jgi:hypothetical protein
MEGKKAPMAHSILMPVAANVRKYDGSNSHDALCTFCGEWCSNGSRCGNRFDAISCNDPSAIACYDPTDGDFKDTYADSLIVYACDKCLHEGRMHPRCNKICFPDGTIMSVDCRWREND